jgi:prephenate dehydrogenase
MRFDRAVVVGGLGEVGGLVVGLLCVEAVVTVVDSRGAGRPGVLADDIRTPGPALESALAEADAVVIALPETVALQAIAVVAARMRPGAVLLDTLSVKSQVVPLLEREATRYGLAALSLNPMFAPALGVSGRPVATVEVVPGPGADRFRNLLLAAGAVPVPVTADRHDRLCAAVQVATHASILAFGDTLRSMRIDPADLLAVAPPPHRTMLALLARLVSGTPEVYRDIQVANPGAPGVRSALIRATDRLRDRTTTPAGFAAHIEELAAWLGPYRAGLAAQCAAAFAALAPGEPVREQPVQAR